MSPFALDLVGQMGLAELREIYHVPGLDRFGSHGRPQPEDLGTLNPTVLRLNIDGGVPMGSQKGVPKRGKNRHPRNTVLRFTLKIRGSAPEPILGVCGFGLLSVNIGSGTLGAAGRLGR